LEETEKDLDGKVKLFGRIWSKQPDGIQRFHYSASVSLLREMPIGLIHTASINPISASQEPLSGKSLYQNGTLFHGPMFQGVKQVISISESHVVMECMLPKISFKNQGQFPVTSVNPFLNDVIVQSLLIWTQQIYKAPCLPSYLVSFDHYKAIPFDTTCLVDLRIVSHNDFSVVADIWVTDQLGEVYAKFNGLQGTISPSLKRLLDVPIPQTTDSAI
jgi:hypothetical protein